MSCALHGQEPCPLCDPEESLEDWIIREARAISGPRTHLQDPEAVIQFGLRVAGQAAIAAAPRETPPRFRPSRHNMAVGPEGEALPFTPEEVTQIAEKTLETGDVLCAVFRMRSGDLNVQVFGPPSQELVDTLEQTVRAYKRVLRGH